MHPFTPAEEKLIHQALNIGPRGFDCGGTKAAAYTCARMSLVIREVRRRAVEAAEKTLREKRGPKPS